MGSDITTQTTARSAWQTKGVYAMAAVCLLLGLAIGYLFRGSQSPATPIQSAAEIESSAQAPSATPAQTSAAVRSSAAAGAAPSAMAGKMPTLDDMKKMADMKAQPLLTKLKTDPNNADLLIQVGGIYERTHRFKDAAGYYNKALQVTPKNVGVRTEMASCLYYSGDVDGAIGQLQQSLHYDPKNANSLFNLGMMKLQGKQDSQGALAAWRKLLKANPEMDAKHKATVEKLIAEVEKKGKS